MKHIALLRGINVGGQKKIKMADLKALFVGLGHTDVVTYIQSGNVVFEPGNPVGADLTATIATEIEKVFGWAVPVVIRTGEQWRGVVRDCPFGEIDPALNGSKYLVSFLSQAPEAAAVSDLMTAVRAPEQLVVRGQEVYLHCPQGAGKTKLTNVLLEKKLSVAATARNWRSVLKLLELADS